MCCHPSLSVASQIALTLRAVGGLTTAEIARALLVGEGTVTRRITRAKRSIHDSGIPFAMPASGDAARRLDAVLRVLYLVFNEGYASTSGPDLQRSELSAEAIRLTRMLGESRPVLDPGDERPKRRPDPADAHLHRSAPSHEHHGAARRHLTA